jgi:hypothetical protein
MPGSFAVLRPSRAAYGRALRANVWIAVPLLVISVIRVGLNWWLLPFFVAVILLTLGGVLLYFRNARIEYVDGSYTLVSLFGSRRTFLAADAASVVTVNALLGGVPGGVPQLIVLRPDGSKIVRLRGQTWDVVQFTELANDLIAHGVAHEAIPEPITRAALRERYPKVVGWPEAHPIAFGLLLSLAIVVVIFGVVGVLAYSLQV